MTGKQYARYRRLKLGMSQAELAMRLGVAVSTVARRELRGGGRASVTREAEEAIFALGRRKHEREYESRQESTNQSEEITK